MCDRKNLRRVFLVPVLVAVLAAPAAAAPAGKASHYPGQKCDKCHDLQDKSGGSKPAGSVPASGTTTGTGAAGSQSGTGPSQGATPRR